ncbi:hypothetical protein F5Y15DRAFT_186429 [Xylariaceae sp. FL0016]|nr:hypothetical protein F5Y15DRAFT_186429 [Xylariaceae sp. FL0016]
MAEAPFGNLRQRRTGSFPTQPPRRNTGSWGQLEGRVRHIQPREGHHGSIAAEPNDGFTRVNTFEPPPPAGMEEQSLPGFYGGRPAVQRFPRAPYFTPYGPQASMYEPDMSEIDDPRFEWVRRKKRQGKGRLRYRREEPTTSSDSSEYFDDSDHASTCSSEFDDLLEDQVFDYVPIRASRVASEAVTNTDDDSKGVVEEEMSTRGNQNVTAAASLPEILHICHSHYTGEPLLDGLHKAEMTILPDLRRQRRPLFRWMHLEHLNLDRIAAEVSRLPMMTDLERSGCAKLLAEVKRKPVKVRPTSKGGSVQHMEPGITRVDIPEEGHIRDRTEPRPLTWLCMPYFSLEKYAGELSSENFSSFPLETLLQYKYSRTTEKREKQQVVWQNDQSKEGHCFHVGQLWCIILDNSLLITCGHMSGASLRRDIITTAPGSFGELGVQSRSLFVSYLDSVLWELPLASCSTWFDFSTQFRDFWPQAVEFYHNDQLLSEKSWPRIVNLTEHANTRITLRLRVGQHQHTSKRGIMRPLEPEAEGPITSANAATDDKIKGPPDSLPRLPFNVNDRFHVFTWMDTVQANTDSRSLDRTALYQQFENLRKYILNSTELKDRRSYRHCTRSSRQELHAYLEEQRVTIESSGDSPNKDLDYERKVDLYNAADVVYGFFLPCSIGKGLPTTNAFWGAIHEFIKQTSQSTESGTGDRDYEAVASARETATSNRRRQSRRTQLRQNIIPVDRTLRKMGRRIETFQKIMSNVPVTARAKIVVPDNLIRAWLHLILALVQAASGRNGWDDKHLGVAEALIDKGMSEVMNMTPAEDLIRRVVVQPVDVVALLCEKLIRDSTGRNPNISDTYSEHLKNLENDIMTKYADRSTQLHFPLFNQEVDIIRHVVGMQRMIISSLRSPKSHYGGPNRENKIIANRIEERRRLPENGNIRKRTGTYQVETYPHYHARQTYSPAWVTGFATDYGNVPESFSKMTPTNPGGLLEVFRWACESWLDRRQAEFDELGNEAQRLEITSANKVEATKDRQEAAMYAFTMVTIIFLPLSTISSIFGMNSSDVRDMDAGQWVYWATALPITVFVILAGLWWMNELGAVIDWVRSLSPGRRRLKQQDDIAVLERYASQRAPPYNPFSPPPPPTESPVYDPPDFGLTGRERRASYY